MLLPKSGRLPEAASLYEGPVVVSEHHDHADCQHKLDPGNDWEQGAAVGKR